MTSTFHGIPTEELDRWLDELTVPRDHKPTRPAKPSKPAARCPICGEFASLKPTRYIGRVPHHRECLGDMLNIEEWKEEK